MDVPCREMLPSSSCSMGLVGETGENAIALIQTQSASNTRHNRGNTNTGGMKRGERNEARQEGFNEEENGNQQHDVWTGRQANRRQEVPRRQLPQRTRRPPSKLKDFVVGYKNRETEV